MPKLLRASLHCFAASAYEIGRCCAPALTTTTTARDEIARGTLDAYRLVAARLFDRPAQRARRFAATKCGALPAVFRVACRMLAMLRAVHSPAALRLIAVRLDARFRNQLDCRPLLVRCWFMAAGVIALYC